MWVVNMKPACPTQFPACLLCNRLVGLVFTACLYVFPTCPAEMLLTKRLKTVILSVLTGSVQFRSVMFMTGLLAFKYGRLVKPACLEVEPWYLTKTGRQVFQDKMVTVYDKTGRVTDKL